MALPEDTAAIENAVEAAVALLREGRDTEAEPTLESVLKASPRHSRAMHNLGLIALRRGQIDRARALVEGSLEAEPDHTAYLRNLVAVCRAGNDHAAVALACRRLLALEPDSVDILIALGNALLHSGEALQARPRFEWALRLDPTTGEAHNGLGAVWVQAKDHGRAIEHYQRAAEYLPEDALVHCNLGDTWLGLNRHVDAAIAYRESLRRNPGLVRALSSLGFCLAETGEAAEAVALLSRAIETAPEDPVHWFRKGMAELRLWRHTDAWAAFQQCMASDPEQTDLLSAIAFALHYLPVLDAASIADVHRNYGQRLLRQVSPCATHANNIDPERKLRLGYLSGDFREHSVMHFIRPLLLHHDRNAFEIHGFMSCVAVDELTEEARGLVDHWHDAWKLSDEQLTALIRKLEIDVLVDLSGHSQNHRLATLARKPAPVQITWLGYFNTTGLPTVDWIVADSVLIPTDEEYLYTERPLRLPQGHLCLDPMMEPLPVEPLPMLASGHVTFGCFNSLDKLNPDVVDLWARVLKRLPGSRLHLKNRMLAQTSTRTLVRNAFQAAGVSPDRLILEPESSRREYYAAYGGIDIAFDTFPYRGGTTTLQALWMGVPVLSLRGTEGMIEHFGESILGTVGLHDWIAEDANDFVNKAVRFAADHEALRKLRGTLRERLLASPAGNAQAFTRNLEHAWRRAWRDWCTRQVQAPA